MSRFVLAMRAFYRILVQAEVAQRVATVLEGPEEPAGTTAAKPPAATPSRSAKSPAPARSEALTLLAALQREARFLDLVMEPLTSFSDAQIGAAARDVLRGCQVVLTRSLGIQPLRSETEGQMIEVPAGFDAGCYRLVGNVSGKPPYQGKLVHPGWQAEKCDLPSWTGSAEATRVLAPAEVELA